MLDKIQANKCDALIIDYKLSSQQAVSYNGVELVKAIEDRFSSFPMFILTSHESDLYDLHLDRDATGKIYAKTKLGEFIIKELNLSLIRHEIIYNLEVLWNRTESLKASIEVDKENGIDISLKEKILSDLYEKFYNYYNIFLINQNN